ncbi:MAG: hypothetical protein GY801_30500 [bacterium]|nr:hypothetical protein [bacterium]
MIQDGWRITADPLRFRYSGVNTYYRSCCRKG